MTTTTGIIGIGNMGMAIALRLLELGRAVRVRDIAADRETIAAAHGADVAASAAALARGCDCVIIAVVDAALCEDVLFASAGAAAALPAGAAVLLCPTLGPASTVAIAGRLAERGIDCIDAPMSGGPERARNGTMSLMVACPDAVFERHRGPIEALSSTILRVGERAGDGARTKLVNNLLAAVNLAGAAEALALAERLGLDSARTLAVIEQSSGQSRIGSDRMRRAIARDLAPRAHTTLLAKDTRLAIEMAAGIGFDAPFGRAAAAVFGAACAAGHGSLDDACLLQLMRERKGALR